MMIFVVADIWNWYNMDMKYTNKSGEKNDVSKYGE